MIDVSIVIVCMNNLKNLYPCLKSIKMHTNTVSYETFVVAYLFSKENLEKVKIDFPWVTFIESNEIRGFSENNNLALRHAKGKYCFVVNDDTEMNQPVIDILFQNINKLPKEIAIISPQILLDRTKRILLGKPRFSFYTFLLDNLMLSSLYRRKSPYINKQGIFQTYNISGASFLIKTDIFKKLGWFDEKYFFCPEDIALSTKVNENGYKCYVNSEVEIHHYSGGTWSTSIKATKPAAVKGEYYFYCSNSFLKKFVFISFLSIIFCGKMLYWLTLGRHLKKEKSHMMFEANRNAFVSLYSQKTPKELFIKYFKRV